jgi:hypothetical protein
MHRAILTLHILAGTIGMLGGYSALFAAKGSRLYRTAGTAFVYAMFLLGTSTTVLGYTSHKPDDVVSGFLVLYVVSTAWMTVKRKPLQIGAFEYIAFAIVLLALAFDLYSLYGSLTSGRGAVRNLVVGAVVLGLMAAGDPRNILKHGLSSKQRLIRHVWRMCFGVFVAAGRIFIARIHVFPAFIRDTSARFAIFALPFVPLLLILFWMPRIRFLRWVPSRTS